MAAIVDLSLADAPEGQDVGLMIANGAATIVLTGIMDAETHKRIASKAIVAVAKTLSQAFRGSDLVARMGGKEFCVLAVNPGAPMDVFERCREQIEALEIPLPEGEPLRLAISGGVTSQVGDSLHDMINAAD